MHFLPKNAAKILRNRIDSRRKPLDPQSFPAIEDQLPKWESFLKNQVKMISLGIRWGFRAAHGWVFPSNSSLCLKMGIWPFKIPTKPIVYSSVGKSSQTQGDRIKTGKVNRHCWLEHDAVSSSHKKRHRLMRHLCSLSLYSIYSTGFPSAAMVSTNS